LRKFKNYKIKTKSTSKKNHPNQQEEEKEGSDPARSRIWVDSHCNAGPANPTKQRKEG
jgi:hypothetical protein